MVLRQGNVIGLGDPGSNGIPGGDPMTSRHEDRDGTSTALLGWGREMSRALFIHWLRIHARTPVHSHDHDDRVTSVLATRSHRCALSEPYFRLVAKAVSHPTECGRQ